MNPVQVLGREGPKSLNLNGLGSYNEEKPPRNLIHSGSACRLMLPIPPANADSGQYLTLEVGRRMPTSVVRLARQSYGRGTGRERIGQTAGMIDVAGSGITRPG
jgi:hypothetical protein